MASAPPRPIRIPRDGTSGPRAVRITAAAPSTERTSRPTGRERKKNRYATQRAVRISLLFILAIAVMYGAFAVLANQTVGGTAPGVEQQVELFGLVAVALAVAGPALTLGSAPRAIEIGPEGTRVFRRFGGLRRFPSTAPLSVLLIRRYEAGLLSSGAIDVVELRSGSQRATYFLDAGLLPVLYDAQLERRG